MAAASGIEHIKQEERDPLVATTYGVGELIRSALEQGARHIILGLGGSATNDGGCGMAQALGASLFDVDGHELPVGGAALINLDSIDLSGLDPRIKEVQIEAATDVTNPLTGVTSASAIFGPKKVQTPTRLLSWIRHLEGSLRLYDATINKRFRSSPEVVRQAVWGPELSFS